MVLKKEQVQKLKIKKCKTFSFLCGMISAIFIFGGCTKPVSDITVTTERISIDENIQSETPSTQDSNQPQSQAGGDTDMQVQIEQFLQSMTLEEKIAQLFYIRPEALTGADTVTAAGDQTKSSFEQYPVGGLIYFARNLVDPAQTKAMLANTQQYAMECLNIPVFIGIDEEGGLVARVAGNSAFAIENIGNMQAIGATGDTTKAYAVGTTLASYLLNLGFNMDFAPDADVLTNPENTVIGSRSFGTDTQLVSEMVINVLQGLKDQGMPGVVKHFPGHGATSGDTHEGFAYTNKTLEEMMTGELIPFQKAIEWGVDFVMVGHFAAPQVVGDDTPCSLSKVMVTDILRNQLGYDGIIITDAMDMGALTESYDSKTAAVMAIEAGNDMLLMPENFKEAYNGILEAVQSGNIREERINESLRRILKVKLVME